jgi:hypothetical protein
MYSSGYYTQLERALPLHSAPKKSAPASAGQRGWLSLDPLPKAWARATAAARHMQVDIYVPACSCACGAR